MPPAGGETGRSNLTSLAGSAIGPKSTARESDSIPALDSRFPIRLCMLRMYRGY